MSTTTQTETKKSNRLMDAYNKKKTALNGNGHYEEPAAKKVEKQKANAAIANASKKTQDTVVKSLAQLKLTLTDSIDSISNQLSVEIASLKEVQDAITAEKENLTNLYGIVAEADSLQALILAQKEEKDSFEMEMQSQKNAWKEEKKLYEKTQMDLHAEQQKNRKWEEEQYQYEKNKKKKLEDDAIHNERLLQQKAFDDTIQAKTQQIEDREKVVKAHEAELASLKEQAANFDKVVKAEVDKHVAIATNSLKKDLNHEHALAKIHLDNQLGLKTAEIASLQERIKELIAQNSALDAKYKEASDKVQTIAEKAIEGASKQATVFQMPNNENGNGRK